MRGCFTWIKMVFEFLKNLFGWLETSAGRKRRAEEQHDDYPIGLLSPKKQCCGHESTRYGRIIYANENDDEEVQFLGESHYSPLRTKDCLNGTSRGKRKLSSTFQRTNENYCKNSIPKMNGRDSKPSRYSFSGKNSMPVSTSSSTLAKTNQLLEKHAYSQLLQNFLPSRVHVIRNKPQEDASKRQCNTEVIDLEKLHEPSSTLRRRTWNKDDVFFTPQASTPLKYYTPREPKSKNKNADTKIPTITIDFAKDASSQRTPLQFFTPRETKIPSSRRSLNARAKDEDVSIIDSRKILNERSATSSKIVPTIVIEEPTPKPEKPSTSRIERSEIVVTNTLRDNLAAKEVMKQDFVPRVYKSYNERMEQRLKEAEELKKITCLMSKNNRLTREAALETQLARSMRLCEAVLDESEQFEEEALPTLTPVMLQEIRHALVPNPPNECLVDSFGLRITRKDIHTLSGLNWLNDEIINFYMNLLIARGNGSNDRYPRVHAMNTFFYPKLLSGGHASLKRWTRKIDIFAQDLLVVPIHLDIHWCMSVIDFRDKSIRYFDSMGGSNPKCLAALRQYLEDESMDKKKKPFDTNDWKLVSMKNIPQQMNGSDCGVFSCMFAEFLTADRKITFTQQDMPYFRHKMVYEIIKAKLL